MNTPLGNIHFGQSAQTALLNNIQKKNLTAASLTGSNDQVLFSGKSTGGKRGARATIAALATSLLALTACGETPNEAAPVEQAPVTTVVEDTTSAPEEATDTTPETTEKITDETTQPSTTEASDNSANENVEETESTEAPAEVDSPDSNLDNIDISRYAFYKDLGNPGDFSQPIAEPTAEQTQLAKRVEAQLIEYLGGNPEILKAFQEYYTVNLFFDENRAPVAPDNKIAPQVLCQFDHQPDGSYQGGFFAATDIIELSLDDKTPDGNNNLALILSHAIECMEGGDWDAGNNLFSQVDGDMQYFTAEESARFAELTSNILDTIKNNPDALPSNFGRNGIFTNPDFTFSEQIQDKAVLGSVTEVYFDMREHPELIAELDSDLQEAIGIVARVYEDR